MCVYDVNKLSALFMDSTFFNNEEIITTVTHWKKYFLLSIALEKKIASKCGFNDFMISNKSHFKNL